MGIEAAIHGKLTGHATVAALVGTRVYPQIIPQTAALPCLTYRQVTGRHARHMAGPETAVYSGWQINCWASTPLAAAALADAVRIALDGQTGTWGGVTIFHSMVTGQTDVLSQLSGAESQNRFGKALDVAIGYTEPVA